MKKWITAGFISCFVFALAFTPSLATAAPKDTSGDEVVAAKNDKPKKSKDKPDKDNNPDDGNNGGGNDNKPPKDKDK